MTIEMSRDVAKKVLSVVDAGLISGMGKPEPGFMCVEAAVCYAMDLPHSDKPSCVGEAVRQFKIRLNDSNWPSNEARTAGMRKLSIAQLGSDSIDQWQFANFVALECQKRILPKVLRYAASFKGDYSDRLEEAAKVCEAAATLEEAKETTKAARALTKAAYAEAYVYANSYADANTYANAYAYAYSYAYAYANADTDAYAYVYANTYANVTTYAIAYAEFRHELLKLLAQIGLEALIDCKSPGCSWLDLCD